MSDEYLGMLSEEVYILNLLDHPNIVRYFEAYDDSRYIYLVMECIEGRNLLEEFDKREQEGELFTEQEAASIMF